ncbi:MAG: hypothetical protein Q4F27_02115, partial [Desulfovibrionaceae bacterium]|nr:hypothetical protein [Desulfovibrionaceae bacterium]
MQNPQEVQLAVEALRAALPQWLAHAFTPGTQMAAPVALVLGTGLSPLADVLLTGGGDRPGLRV